MSTETQAETQTSIALGEPKDAVFMRILKSAAFAKILVGVIILVSWQVAADLFAANFVARPTGIIEAIPAVLEHPRFFPAIKNTLGALCVGIVIALFFGIIVGVLMGRIKVVDRLLSFYVIGFYAMPMVAIIPTLTIWFGSTGGATRMAIILFAGFFSIALNMSDGARATPPEYVEVARAYRARPWDIWFGISIPAAMPYLLAGIRLAAGRALVGAIVAEMIVGVPRSMGNFIRFESGNLRYDEAFVAVLVLAFFGVAIELLLNWSTRFLLPWYRREGRAA